MNPGKNWLIRTRSNHILGPVSKEKVNELYSNGSIKADDEVCTGNGYWFFLRETDLVERFLTGNETQGFNPISEAKDVLTASGKSDRERTSDDITLIGSLNFKTLREEPKAAPQSALNEVEEVEEELEEVPVEEETPEPAKPEPKIDPKKKVRTEPEVKASAAPKSQKPLPPKQDYLFYIMAVGFLILLFLVYFRKSILGSFFAHVPNISLISEAHAQDEGPAKKKSSLIKPSR